VDSSATLRANGGAGGNGTFGGSGLGTWYSGGGGGGAGGLVRVEYVEQAAAPILAASGALGGLGSESTGTTRAGPGAGGGTSSVAVAMGSWPADTGRYIVGKPSREVLYRPTGGGNGEWVRDVRFYYDGSQSYTNPIGSGDDGTLRGRLTAVRRVLDGTNSVDVSFAHDAYGNVTQARTFEAYGPTSGGLAGGTSRLTETEFEPTHQTFPVRTTNPLGHRVDATFDARWGRPLSVTAPYLPGDTGYGVTNYTYDTFGRLTRAEGPQVSGPNGAYRPTTEYTYATPATTGAGRTTTPLKARVRTDLGGSAAWRSTWQHYDGLGRVVQAYGDTVGGVHIVNTYYDRRGLVWRTSVPHVVGASENFLENDWAAASGPDTRPTYDELRRVRTTYLPGSLTTEARYDGWDVEAIDPKRHKTRREHDALGRLVTVREYTGTDANWAQYAATTYEYTVANDLTRVTDAVGNQTTLTYDAFGRKTQMADPDLGTWTYEYDPIGTLKAQTDAKGQRTDHFYDALGRLVRTWYPLAPAPPASSTWTQEAIAPGASRCTVYDLMELRCAVDTDRVAAGLGAATWMDPEIVAGRDVPVRAVHFNELRDRIGELWDAAGLGQVPGFSGEPIVVPEEGPPTRLIKATDLTDLRGWLQYYEASAWAAARRARVVQEHDQYVAGTQHGRGRRTAMWDGCGRQAWTYDAAGRVTRQERTIDGRLYADQWSHDALGRVHTHTLPSEPGVSGEALTHAYGAHGLLTGLTGVLSGGQAVTLLSNVLYTALGQPREWTLGPAETAPGVTATGRQTFYGLDGVAQGSAPFGALKTLQLQQGASPMLVNRELAYDAAGNVTSVNDLVNSETVTYAYDDLDRLLSASAPVNEAYAYNAIGNLTSKGGQSLSYPAPGQPRPHGATAFGAWTYGYDANGAMTTRNAAEGSQALKYDPQRRPVRVHLATGAAEAPVWRAAYGGDGARRKRLDAAGTVHYVGPHYERNVGTGSVVLERVTKHYRALGRLIALRKDGILSWVGTDHLGSTVRVAQADFAPLDQLRYLPYGGPRDPAALLRTDHRFTSQVRDSSLGLDWFASRAYDPALGRFTAPDTVVPDPARPQSLNRYSYVRNNPLRYTDPSGHYEVELRYRHLEQNALLRALPVHHAFVVVTDTDGTRTVFSADPSGSFPTFGTIVARADTFQERGLEWPNAGPEPVPVAVHVVVPMNDEPAGPYVAQLQEYTEAVNAAQVPYLGTRQNSNSFAHEAVEAVTGARPAPPVYAPGWRDPLLDDPAAHLAELASDSAADLLNGASDGLAGLLNEASEGLADLLNHAAGAPPDLLDPNAGDPSGGGGGGFGDTGITVIALDGGEELPLDAAG
jgi:RHS repeat-associated protein